MVRPYRKPGNAGSTTTFYWCPSCEEWRDENKYTRDTYYSTDGYDYIEVDNEYYYESYASYEIWKCDECGEAVSGLDGSPDTKTSGNEMWYCAACDSPYEDKYDADECCG